MSLDRERLKRLKEMAALVFDTRSQALRRANEARDALLRQLADLEAGPAAEGLPWPSAERARFGYEQWAAGRRAGINRLLAAQTAVCLQAAEETRMAFGRVRVLEQLPVTGRKADRGEPAD